VLLLVLKQGGKESKQTCWLFAFHQYRPAASALCFTMTATACILQTPAPSPLNSRAHLLVASNDIPPPPDVVCQAPPLLHRSLQPPPRAALTCL
jgi:hypothetical protein